MKRILALTLVLVSALTLLAACGGGTGGTGANGTWGKGEFAIYPAFVEMPSGSSVYPDWSAAKSAELVWLSSDPAVASVGADGLITGVSEGLATITAALAKKPQVTASCGVYVKPFNDGEVAVNEILIWEDSLPSDYYMAVMYGVTPPAGATAPNTKAGENLPIALPLSEYAEAATAKSAAAAKKTPPKKVKVNRKDIKKGLKNNITWKILLSDTYIDTHPLFFENDGQISTWKYSINVSKRGGSTPEGSYTGTISYERFENFDAHFAKWPDHSWCDNPNCSMMYREYRGQGEWGTWRGGATGGRSLQGDDLLEWETYREWYYTGYYVNSRRGNDRDPAFTIKQSDVRRRPTALPLDLYDNDDLPPALARLWFTFEASYICYSRSTQNEPTNLGNNWGRSDTHEWSARFVYKVLDNGMVLVDCDGRKNLRGTLTRSIESKNQAYTTPQGLTDIKNDLNKKENEPPPTEPPMTAAPATTKKPDPPKGYVDPPSTNLPSIETDKWPAAYLPPGLPEYPGGTLEVTAAPGNVIMNIYNTSSAELEAYMALLESDGWEVWDYKGLQEGDLVMGTKGLWWFQSQFDTVTYRENPRDYDSALSVLEYASLQFMYEEWGM